MSYVGPPYVQGPASLCTGHHTWALLVTSWTVPKYRSTNTSSYIRHRTVQCGCILALVIAALRHPRCIHQDALNKSRVASRVAHRFGSDKLYICLNNKCFNCIQCIRCVTDIRPSQDLRILRVQMVRINLAIWLPRLETCSDWQRIRPSQFKSFRQSLRCKIIWNKIAFQ